MKKMKTNHCVVNAIICDHCLCCDPDDRLCFFLYYLYLSTVSAIVIVLDLCAVILISIFCFLCLYLYLCSMHALASHSMIQHLSPSSSHWDQLDRRAKPLQAQKQPKAK